MKMSTIIWEKIPRIESVNGRECIMEFYEAYVDGELRRYISIDARGRAMVYQAPYVTPWMNPLQFSGKFHSLEEAWKSVEREFNESRTERESRGPSPDPELDYHADSVKSAARQAHGIHERHQKRSGRKASFYLVR
jgi:hypothetical protein